MLLGLFAELCCPDGAGGFMKKAAGAPDGSNAGTNGKKRHQFFAAKMAGGGSPSRARNLTTSLYR